MDTTNNQHFLQIGEIASKANTSVRTVRYYMEEGFIEAADRSPGGFYLFTPETAETVFYIHKLKAAGMALKDIKAIYHARQRGQSGEEASSKVLGHLEAQKAIVEKKIADYRQLKTEIDAAIKIVAQCHGCSIAPTSENCRKCPVVKRKKKLPLPVQAIL